MWIFGLWPLPQNSDNRFAFGDLIRLRPVAKAMCPPKFVLALVEKLRVTAGSYSQSSFSSSLKPQQPLDAHYAVLWRQASFSSSQAVDCKLWSWHCEFLLPQQHDDNNMLPFECHLYLYCARCFICVISFHPWRTTFQMRKSRLREVKQLVCSQRAKWKREIWSWECSLSPFSPLVSLYSQGFTLVGFLRFFFQQTMQKSTSWPDLLEMDVSLSTCHISDTVCGPFQYVSMFSPHWKPERLV